MNDDLSIIMDHMFYEYKPLASNADWIIATYFLFEIVRSGEDSQLFSSSSITKDMGFGKPAQQKALEMASAHGILEVDSLRSIGKNIKFGKVIMELLYGELGEKFEDV